VILLAGHLVDGSGSEWVPFAEKWTWGAQNAVQGAMIVPKIEKVDLT